MPHKTEHIRANSTIANLRTAFVLNLIFAILEVIGGLLTNSVAILSDAVHGLRLNSGRMTAGSRWMVACERDVLRRSIAQLLVPHGNLVE